MAGYNHLEGMSNSAVSAYNRGCRPLSQITRGNLAAAGLTFSKTFAVWLAKTGHWEPSESHHSGGTWYNRVEFYSAEGLAESIQDGELDLPALEAEFEAARKTTAEPGVRVKGHYTVWGGSRSHPKNLGEELFTGTKIGAWIQIDGGGKKKASGNHISWTEL